MSIRVTILVRENCDEKNAQEIKQKSSTKTKIKSCTITYFSTTFRSKSSIFLKEKW